MKYALDGVRVTFDDDEHWIAPNAVVIGRVHIGSNASVWWNAVLRGDNEPIVVGPGSNVQDGCVLHTDPGFPLTIGRNVTVGHMAMLHGCTIGDGALIGIGAVVLDGAKIGRNCVIGAKALVTAGSDIPDNSMVLGAPGKVVRTLTPEQIERFSENAKFYQGNWKRFRGGLAPDPD